MLSIQRQCQINLEYASQYFSSLFGKAVKEITGTRLQISILRAAHINLQVLCFWTSFKRYWTRRAMLVENIREFFC